MLNSRSYRQERNHPAKMHSELPTSYKQGFAGLVWELGRKCQLCHVLLHLPWARFCAVEEVGVLGLLWARTRGSFWQQKLPPLHSGEWSRRTAPEVASTSDFLLYLPTSEKRTREFFGAHKWLQFMDVEPWHPYPWNGRAHMAYDRRWTYCSTWHIIGLQ